MAIQTVLLVGAIALLVLSCTLAIELIAALISPFNRVTSHADPTGSYVVIIPAHDEVGTIEHTLTAALREVDSSGRVLVVADNCTDDTAAVAMAAGASVIVRQEPQRRGKGYALDFAVRHLSALPPDVVIILDADCLPEPGAISKLFAACRLWHRPIQARYELDTPDKAAGLLARAGAFAWRVKNILRPSGLAALGIPCPLMGTGMAFPWATLATSHLETGHIVEDMVLGLELAARGDGALFLPDACVRSALPPSLEGQKSQRTRWETGHLQVIRQYVPKLMLAAIGRADYRLFGIALHTAVPPLALFVLLLVAMTMVSALVALAGGPSLPLALSGLAVFIAGAVFGGYWYKIGRDLLSIRELILLPKYALLKLPIYGRALSGRRIEWLRSRRN